VIPDTETRVPAHTDAEINERIAEDLTRRIVGFAHRLDDIDRRLRELDREWDIERTLETNASAVILTSLVLGTFFNRKFYALSALAAAFLMQHAIQGWCPPIPLLRRLGVRTAGEIAKERYALKALRGDFDQLAAVRDGPPIERALEAMRAVEVNGLRPRPSHS
jgi:hypothetical protein